MDRAHSHAAFLVLQVGLLLRYHSHLRRFRLPSPRPRRCRSSLRGALLNLRSFRLGLVPRLPLPGAPGSEQKVRHPPVSFVVTVFYYFILRESLLILFFAGGGEVSMSPAPGPQLPPGVPQPSFFARPAEVDAMRRERHAPEPGRCWLILQLLTDCWHTGISIPLGCLGTVVVKDLVLLHCR